MTSSLDDQAGNPLANPWLAIVMALVGVCLFALIRYSLFPLPQNPLLSIWGMLGFTVFLWPLRYGEHLSKGSALLLRGLVLMWMFFVVMRTPHLPSTDALDATLVFQIALAPWLVAIAGVAAMYRPCFALPVLVLSYWQTQGLDLHFELALRAEVDFVVNLEVPVYLLAMHYVAWVYGRVRRLPADLDNTRLSDWFLLCALCIHLANYFYAGVGKVMLDEPWTWLLQNPTHYLMAGAAAHGTAPIALVPGLFQALFDVMNAGYFPLLNAWVLVIQLGALFAVFGKRILLLCLAFYDVLHVGIFLLTGLLFWKWIALNSLAIVAVGMIKRFPSEWNSRLAAMGLVLVSTLIFRIWWLAWFDTPANNVFMVHAELANGQRVRVPSNYFTSHSFNFSASWNVRPGDAYYPTANWGITTIAENFRTAAECTSVEEAVAEPASFELSPETVAFIAAYHDQAVDHYRTRGGHSYDVYPHHAWSMPGEFRPFYDVDPATIAAYVVTLDARCLDVRNGKVQGASIATAEIRIPLTSDA